MPRLKPGHPLCSQSQVVRHRTKETGDISRRQANTFDMFGQHSAEPASTLLTGTTLLRTYHRPHFFLYKLRVGTADFLFEFFTL